MTIKVAAEQAVINVSGKIAAGGGVVAVGSGVVGKVVESVSQPDVAVTAISVSSVGVMFGAAVGAGGLLMQWYFNHRRDNRESAAERRAEELHQAKISSLRERTNNLGGRDEL